ncbi:phospholipid/cholesterol/gamma-HCH transport system permease protein [Rhodoblastus acidophilus]|uniref:MlaE family ABC transporter permease n=1 Tax=Rhodoblastus acidophilus TaxID=1074 RepID=UPI002224AC65|nr:ABC transporter permease [Rhodoblastus acidophilus]MCW2286545.1 phospholipid/cholesterol/gamma-HCH transport system permease protein [Rhodoblastus acidophilus]MCW2335394.1 phospholipid/cholesterol/gamma-HCH transport system permease protein [Rhodoblastus acidophilus]
MAGDCLIEIEHGSDRIALTGSGAWVAFNARRLEVLIDRIFSLDTRRIEVNAADISQFDTFGAVALDRLARGDGRHDVVVTGLSGRYAGLYEKVREAGKEHPPRDKQTSALAEIGAALQNFGADGLRYLHMIGAFAMALACVVTRPRRLRLPSLANQIDRVGWKSIPIITLITLLIGGIIAQQGIFHFRRFGAEDYVVDLVGILILREIGVLLVAIMVAGRSGSSYTAELGSMKMREEIDALRTMGREPMEVLILPRVLALVVGLPALAFLGSIAALFGGGLVAWIYGGMDPSIYVARLREAVSMTDFEVGMIKAPFMALVIGLVACTEGLKVQGSSESLGLQTTASVVKSIFMVIVLDGFFAIFFSSIGM